MDLTARFLNPPTEDTPRDPPPDDPLEGVKFLRQVQRRLPVEEITALVAAYRGGASVSELTRSYGINRTTVLEHLERNQVPRRPHVRKLTDRQVAEAARLYDAGWSHSQLGKKFFVSAETIRKELLKAGVTSRPPGRPAASPTTDQAALGGS